MGGNGSNAPMTQTSPIRTIAALESLGFVPKPSAPFGRDFLYFHFGNFELEMLGEDFSGRLCFGGLVPGDGRTLYAPIEFHLLKEVVSIEQCALLIAYYLRDYPIARLPAWLIEGRRDRHLLPWNLDAARRQAAYDALPKCFVRRDWLRLGLTSLSAMIAAKPDDTVVRFAFANDVLSVECGDERFVVSASGLPWRAPSPCGPAISAHCRVD